MHGTRSTRKPDNGADDGAIRVNTRAADAVRLRQILSLRPDDRVAWHNLAAAEGDLGRAAEAEAAARRAIALGIKAPETYLVLARALQSLRKLDEADSMFKKAIALRPAYADAHRDLAQLTWMRTGRAQDALKKLARALRESPTDGALHLVHSGVLEFTGDMAGALAAAERGLAHAPNDLSLLRQAAHLIAETGNAARALSIAMRAVQLAPTDTGAQLSVCESLLAAGRAVEGEAKAAALCSSSPNDQYALALRATAWRLMGDPRYSVLHDYRSLVSEQELDTPTGFANRDAFLNALSAELQSLHSFQTHPLNQSVRGGSQLPIQLAELARPLIALLFGAIQTAIDRYISRLGAGNDALRARNTGRAALTGAWSVRLHSGGHHADHVHPHGWLSSACYIALPPSIGDGQAGRAGWLRFGRPAVRTQPALDADHFVQPRRGLLVLFPAYMWHGVEPFDSDQPRLSVAFDVIPA
ncbi:MAG TPA: putative 2OG-Fe(II) oxygenase [Burkholderiaceae bacterium]|nr:putative 2OG-Fe(II) oxygenase [Burkholderiaceae bacterium]